MSTNNGWKYSGIGVVTVALLLAILLLSKCAVDSYRAQAEDRLAPAAPTLTAVEVSRHGEPVPSLAVKPMTAEEREQAAWSERMYKKLNADMASGRRAPNKMGVYEKEDPSGWTVIQGAPPFDPKPEAQATTFTPEEIAAPFDEGVVGQDFVITQAVPPPVYYGGGGFVIQTIPCPECCADLPTKPGTIASVPEPSAIYLLGGGLAGLFLFRRKKIR